MSGSGSYLHMKGRENFFMDCLKINKTVKARIITQTFAATTIFCELFIERWVIKEFMDPVLNRLNEHMELARSVPQLGHKHLKVTVIAIKKR